MTNRPLKVGEMIKRVLAPLIKEEISDPILEKVSIIVSEVKITPDLKSATVYILPMIGSTINNDECLAAIKHNTVKIRKLLCKKIHMRYMPELIFKIDSSFEHAIKINKLINN